MKNIELDAELQKELVAAMRINDAGKTTQILIRCLEPIHAKPFKCTQSSPTDQLISELMPPSLLEFEDDDFDSVDVVSFYFEKSSFLDMKELSDTTVLGEIAVTAAKQGFPDQALKIANRMKEGGDRGEAYEAVIYGYLQAGKLDKVFEHRFLVANLSTRLELLCHIAAVYFSTGNRDVCMKIIPDALCLAKSIGGSFVNKSLGRISLLQAKLGDFTSAHATIQGINEAEIRAIALSHFAVVLAKTGQRAESQEDFADALRETGEIKYSLNRFKCLQLIIEKQAEAGDFDGAVSTAEKIEWDADRAAFLDRTLGDGLPEDFLGCRACAMHGYNEEFQEITARDRGLCHVGEIQAGLGDIAGAMNTVELIKWQPLKAEAQYLIGKSFADADDTISARQRFTSAFMGWLGSRSRSSSVFLWKLALEQAKVGDIDSALTTARYHELPSIRAKIFSGIGRLQAQTEGWEASQEVWREACEAANLVNDVGSRIEILLEIALDQASAGGKDSAHKSFLVARNLSENSINHSWSVRYLLKTADAQAKGGEAEQAHLTLEVARQLAEDRGKIEEIREVAVELAETGFKDDAVETCRAAGSVEWPRVAAVFAEKGDLEAFKRMLYSGCYDAVTVGKTCILLAQAYPDQAEAVAEVLLG